MIYNIILIVIFYFVFRFMKICHESFVDVYSIDNKHNESLDESLDEFELDKSSDYIHAKIVRDKNNNCETNKTLRDVSEIMFFDKNIHIEQINSNKKLI